MKIDICEQLVNGENIAINKKGYEEMEIALEDVNVLSQDKKFRLIGIGKNLYKMTLKSYKKIKKEFIKRGTIYQFDRSKR